ncbi:MAG: lysophospholipase [Leptospirales bacterium]|nr:lysophospholipase [Leptospirales bacterium]
MKKYKHKTGTFKGKGDVELFFQEWTAPSPKAILVIVHGLGEHSGRYDNLLETLSGSGISVYACDNRGFGHSAGKRGHVSSFADYVDDQKIFIDMLKSANPRTPVLMLGHSLGGLIAFKYALEYGASISGIILSSPAFVFTGKVAGWKKTLANMLSTLKPDFSLSSGSDFSGLSHDLEYIESCKNDPLLHDMVSARLYTEFIKTSSECMSRAFEFNPPVLIFHGNADPIIDYKGSETVFERVSSRDKEVHIFDGLYHKTMNEIPEERQKVLAIVASWVKRHSGKPAAAKASGNTKKTASKKTASKKAASKKTASKKTASKKAASKKAASKKAASKKTASKKTASKKTASKKTASKKTASKKTASKKTAKKKS